MSDLLLQSIVERIEAQDLLLKEMSKDADKGQIEIRKKIDELKDDISSLKAARLDSQELKQLTFAVESLRASLSQQVPVKVKPSIFRKQSTWFAVIAFLIFLGMSWCWGYTFRAWNASESDAMKYHFLKSVPNNSLARFCRLADSLYSANSLPVSDTPAVRFAGEKEKKHR